MDTIRRLFGQYRYAAIALVTLVTLGVVGAVVLTTTSVGCGPANKVGLKTVRCLSGSPVAHSSPTPIPIYAQPTKPPERPILPPPTAPSNPDASSIPPYIPPASSTPPYPGSSSSSAPPLAWPGSGLPPNLAFSCRLPVFAGQPGSGGFIVFPGQTFVADPRSAVTAPTPSPAATPSPTPAPPGGGYGGPGPGAYPPGWYGLSYDAQYSRWVSVPYRWVSPDGVHYAYPLNGEIYVQNVADGSQLELGQGHSFTPVDTANDGVYVTSSTQGGLWFLPFSGVAKQLATTGFWQVVAGGAAYGPPTSQVPSGASNTINRLDLKTGAITPFFSDESGVSNAIGYDLQGNPVIQTSYRNGNAIFIATGANTARAIAAVTYGQYYYYPTPPYPQGQPIADGHGLWFSVGSGFVLYSNGTWYGMSSVGGQLAGRCV